MDLLIQMMKMKKKMFGQMGDILYQVNYHFYDWDKLIKAATLHLIKYGGTLIADDNPQLMTIGFKSSITNDSWSIGLNSVRAKFFANKSEFYYICY